MKTCIILLASFLFISCDPIDDRLIIINKTNQSLVINLARLSVDTTSYSEINEPIDNFDFYERQISPNKFKRFVVKGNWESYFDNDTLLLLVFDKEAILKKRGEKPQENYDIEKRIYVSKSYMQKNDWKVTIDSSKSRIIKL